ncbi:hypothetical protein GCM10020254_00650 [Streptomyces goshikiensis]
MLTGPAWAGPQKFKLREVQKTKSVKGQDLKPGKKKTPAPAGQWKPTPVAWPTPGTAEVTLPTPSPLAKTNLFTQSQAGSLPVRVTPTAQPSPSANAKSLAPAKDLAAPGRVKVTVADREKTRQAGIDGLLLSVQRTDGSASAGTAQVEVDYSKIKGAYGANWASSLQLIALPECALTTPSKPECFKGTPLRTRNDPATGTLSAAVNLPAVSGPANKAMAPSAGASWLTAPAGGMSVLAAAPGAAGSDGSFKATSLAASGSWSAGGNAGGFGWNLPIATPRSPAVSRRASTCRTAPRLWTAAPGRPTTRRPGSVRAGSTAPGSSSGRTRRASTTSRAATTPRRWATCAGSRRTRRCR